MRPSSHFFFRPLAVDRDFMEEKSSNSKPRDYGFLSPNCSGFPVGLFDPRKKRTLAWGRVCRLTILVGLTDTPPPSESTLLHTSPPPAFSLSSMASCHLVCSFSPAWAGTLGKWASERPHFGHLRVYFLLTQKFGRGSTALNGLARLLAQQLAPLFISGIVAPNLDALLSTFPLSSWSYF